MSCNRSADSHCALESLESRRLFATTYALVDLGPATPAFTIGSGEGTFQLNNTYMAGTDKVNNVLSGFVKAAKKPVQLAPLPHFGSASGAYDVSEGGVVVGNTSTEATAWVKLKPVDLGAGQALAISSNGKYIVGGADSNGVQHAFVFGKGRKDLGSFGSSLSDAFGVSSTGVVVGVASNQPFFYNGKLQKIQTGTHAGRAIAINDKNIAVGDIDGKAFSYDVTTKRLKTYLPVDQGGTNDIAQAIDINNANQMVGRSISGALGTNSLATIWVGGKPVDLNKLISSKAGVSLAFARSINDKGQILAVGRTTGATSTFHSYLLLPKLAALSSKGSLVINGTIASDVVSVSLSGATVNVNINGATQAFKPSSIKRIGVTLSTGNDTLTLGTHLKPATISGGAGRDLFFIHNGVADTLDGGPDADIAHVDRGDVLLGIETRMA